MKLWSDLFESKQSPSEQFERPAQVSTVARVVGSAGWSHAQTGDDIGRYVQQYERVLMVWRCVDAIATACANVPLQVRDRPGEKGRVIEADRLNYLLNERPNTYETAFQFRYRLSTILKLSRKGAFIEIVRGNRGSVLELHILPNERVTVVGDPHTYVKGYWVDGAHGRTWLSSDRVIWIREKPHPTNVYEQMTPLVAAGLATDTDYLARLFNRNFLANDGRPGMIVAVKGRLNPQDTNKLQARYGGGPSRAGETTVIQADDLSLADMAGSPRDAQWLEAVNGSKQDIMLAFGTPESALGNASGRTYDNADAEFEVWWLETNCNHLNAQANAFVTVTAGGPRSREVVVPDYDTVPVLQRQKRLRHDKLLTEWNAGLITLDEYREGTGRVLFNQPGSQAILGKINVSVLATTDNADPKAVGQVPIIGGQPPVPPGEPGAVPPGPATDDDGYIEGPDAPALSRDVWGAQGEYDQAASMPFRPALDRARRMALEGKSKRRRGLPKTQKCKYCDERATKRLLWAEGMAYIPVCGKHVAKARHRIEVTNSDEVVGIRDIPDTVGTKQGARLQVKAERQPEERTTAEAEMAAVVAALVAQYGAQVGGRFAGTKLRQGTRYWTPPGPAPVDWDRVVNQASSVQRFVEDLTEAVMRIVNRVLRAMSRDYPGGPDLRTLRQETERQVVGPLIGQAREGFERFTATVRQSLADADVEGATRADIDQVVRTVVAEKGKTWAEGAGKFVGATVVEGAQHTFAMLAVDSGSADLVKVWRTMDDDRVRPTHWAVDGDAVGPHDHFRVGAHLMRHPHDPTAPIGETAGCRCFLEWRPRRPEDQVGTPPRLSKGR